jgi:hypothetical protein
MPAELAVRLRSRRIDIVDLGRVATRALLLLGRVLEEGCVLIDRDEQWHLPRRHGVEL